MKQDKQVKTKRKKIGEGKSVRDYTADSIKNITSKSPVTKKSFNNKQNIVALDKIKILLACFVLGFSIYGYYYFRASNIISSNASPFFAYFSPMVGVLGFLLIIFYWCSFGKDLLNYLKEATVELKKVVWPDRKNATRMTMLVLFFVFILALIMWVSDTSIQWILYDIILRR